VLNVLKVNNTIYNHGILTLNCEKHQTFVVEWIKNGNKKYVDQSFNIAFLILFRSRKTIYTTLCRGKCWSGILTPLWC